MISFDINLAGVAAVSVASAIAVRTGPAVLVEAMRGLSVDGWWAVGET
ncbi:hypothetical protein ACIBMZ_08790 [Micromonospora sp. NPDC049900]